MAIETDLHFGCNVYGVFMPSATSVGMCAKLYIQSAISVLLWVFIQSSIWVVMYTGFLCRVLLR